MVKFLYMLTVAGQTAEPNWLKTFEETHGFQKSKFSFQIQIYFLKRLFKKMFLKFHRQRWAIQQIFNNFQDIFIT